MVTQEFYIREASENEARGPFNLEQLVSFAETGGISEETLFYDAGAEQWVSIASSPDLKATVFPERKKLKMKMRTVETVNKPSSESVAPLTVHDMLAASEGKTSETKDKIDPQIGMARTARLGLFGVVGTLAVAAAGEVLPAADAVVSLDFGKIMAQPIVFLGAADILLAVLLLLGLVQLYPLVRFRAALGFGYFGFLFFTHGLTLPFAACTFGAVGLYLETILLQLFPMILASGAAFLGMAGVTYFLIST